MGLIEAVFGGKPTSWTDQQYDEFKTAYKKIMSSPIGLTDYLPPTNLAALGGKAAGLSLKVAMNYGEMGKYASWTVSLHNQLEAGVSLLSAKADFVIRLEGKTLETDTAKVFMAICALHMAVYGKLK